MALETARPERGCPSETSCPRRRLRVSRGRPTNTIGSSLVPPGSRELPRAFVSMVRFTKWLVSKGVPKTAGAAAERLSARLSVIAVLGACAAALFPPSVPIASQVPVEILRTKRTPIILYEQPVERPTN